MRYLLRFIIWLIAVLALLTLINLILGINQQDLFGYRLFFVVAFCAAAALRPLPKWLRKENREI